MVSQASGSEVSNKHVDESENLQKMTDVLSP